MVEAKKHGPEQIMKTLRRIEAAIANPIDSECLKLYRILFFGMRTRNLIVSMAIVRGGSYGVLPQIRCNALYSGLLIGKSKHQSSQVDFAPLKFGPWRLCEDGSRDGRIAPLAAPHCSRGSVEHQSAAQSRHGCKCDGEQPK
jgi:hypothetical protein